MILTISQTVTIRFNYGCYVRFNCNEEVMRGLKVYFDKIKSFTNSISFPALVAGDVHQDALCSMVYAMEEMAEKIEKQDLLIKQLLKDKTT